MKKEKTTVGTFTLPHARTRCRVTATKALRHRRKRDKQISGAEQSQACARTCACMCVCARVCARACETLSSVKSVL